MKALTKDLLYFAFFFLAGTVVFRYCLSHFLETQVHNLVWVVAVTYFFFNLFIGWFFGKRDYEVLPMHDVGFRFHFATYFLFNATSVLWFLFGFHSRFESIGVVYVTALFWGLLLLTHFIFYLKARKNSIKGLSKEDLFE
jgi:hypothetical protein